MNFEKKEVFKLLFKRIFSAEDVEPKVLQGGFQLKKKKRAANTSAFKRIGFLPFWILILLLRSRNKDQRNSKQFSVVRVGKSLVDRHLWVNCFCSLFGWFEPKAANLTQIIVFSL